MSDLSVHIGKKIRLLRKMKGISLEEFSRRINKSVATLSKYENGSISLNIDTLSDIAGALDVDIRLLIDYNLPVRPRLGPDAKTIFGAGDTLYMFSLDPGTSHLIKSLVKVHPQPQHTYAAELFMYVPSFEDYHACKHFYYGSFLPFDIISNFSFENQANGIERLHITVSNPLGNRAFAIGLMMGISTLTMQPSSVKVILSKIIPNDLDELHTLLMFSKEELAQIRKRGTLAVVNPK